MVHALLRLIHSLSGERREAATDWRRARTRGATCLHGRRFDVPRHSSTESSERSDQSALEVSRIVPASCFSPGLSLTDLTGFPFTTTENSIPGTRLEIEN
jgi:hypothetical protein